jgi:hypothetical protein
MTMMCPLSLTPQDNVVLSTEENPESGNTQGPLALQLGEGTIELLRSFSDLTDVILGKNGWGRQGSRKVLMG